VKTDCENKYESRQGRKTNGLTEDILAGKVKELQKKMRGGTTQGKLTRKI
jgi:hypothetical protein